jgi:hypothetical protein
MSNPFVIIKLMAEIEPSTPTDCAETGRLLTLAGAKLAELVHHSLRPTLYYGAADTLGIFQSTLTEARLQATESGLISYDFSSIQDRLTSRGQRELAAMTPIGGYATALGALLVNRTETTIDN